MNKINKLKIIKNQVLADGIHLLSLKVSEPLEAKPGQFFILRMNERYDPLLGRPLSIFDLEGEKISFLFRVKGKGTKILSTLTVGEEIQITGPFGKWYPFPHGEFAVIAGGIGIASVFYLIKKFPKKAYLFYGARNLSEILFYEELKDLCKELFIITECGRGEYKGIVTETFREKGLKLNLPIYACGPMVMIKELRKILEENHTHLPCFVAVEERMACGLGACLGCVIETTEGFKRVCTEGPVFKMNELKL